MAYLGWSYDGLAPYEWEVQQSDDGISGWTDYGTVPADLNVTEFHINVGKYYVVVGRDAGHVPVTDYSAVFFYAP